MSTKTDLPEYQIFSILRGGEEDPIGPYSQDQIVNLLNDGDILSSDLVYFDGLEDWKPLGEVFELHEGISNFEDEGQDRSLVGQVFADLSDVTAKDEEIYYIAVQDKPPIRLKGPAVIAVTDRRVCIAHQKLNGSLSFDIYYWSDIHLASVRIKGREHLRVFSILLRSGERIEIDRIPVPQLEKLEQLANDFGENERSLRG
tara:strand:+ start:15919 stop:16521 length:603 start_codon:yes stop_codon:yes gene_type:complete